MTIVVGHLFGIKPMRFLTAIVLVVAPARMKRPIALLTEVTHPFLLPTFFLLIPHFEAFLFPNLSL
jgi:hypothetical protein